MFDNLMLMLDEFVTGVLGEWNILTTFIFASIISFFIYNVISSRDPDAHPMLLARQAQSSPVRQEGQSAIFRSQSAPHGMPLNSGLNVKDPGDSKWSRGRDGDLRDVWRRVIGGKVDKEGKETGEKGKLITILGSEKVIEHDLADINRQINIIGQSIKQNGGKNVAIYLPNSVELLATLFSSAFYDLTAILVPYDLPIDKIISLLHESKADTVVAAVGSFPFDVITKSYPALKQLIWVVDEGSKHMDWNEVPKGTGGPVNVSTWQDIVQDAPPSSGSELPLIDRTAALTKVIAFSPSGKLVEYTQANIIAGTAGQLSSVPTSQRFNPADLFLPVDSLTSIYPLVLTLAALYSNASIALNSVADKSSNLLLATKSVAPTVIVTSPEVLSKVLSETDVKISSPLYKIVHWFQTRALIEDGSMPNSTIFSRPFDALRPKLGSGASKLRTIYISEQIEGNSTHLSAQDLSDLRIYTGARIIYALASPLVAGAVTQTSIFDYRVKVADKRSHLGAPTTSVEIYFKDKGEYKTTDGTSQGELHARGPAVVGEEADLGIIGKIKEDFTLAVQPF